MTVDVFAQNILQDVVSGIMASSVLVILLLLGIIAARVVANIIRKLSKTAKIEESVKKKNLEKALLGFSITDIVAILAEVYIVLLAVAIAGDFSGLNVLAGWAKDALDYMAAAVQGIILLVIGLFVAEYVANRIKNSGVVAANVLGIAVEVFIAYNALVLALPSLFPTADTELLKQSFALLIVALAAGVALAVGLGFGLGMKDAVAGVLRDNSMKIEELIFGKRAAKPSSTGQKRRKTSRRR